MKNIFLLFTALVFISIVSKAARDENVTIIEKPASPSGIYRDSSEFNRLNKTASITYMALGVGPSHSGSIGLNFDYFLDRNSLLDLEFVNGRPYEWNWLSNYDVKTSSVGLHYKQFVSNSFYFRVGADYRKIDFRYTSKNYLLNDGTMYIDNRFKGSSVTATILIGNQWQWENFTLGCDWYGYAIPVTTQIDSESAGGTNPNQQYLDDDKETYVKKSTPMGLRFYLGAAF